MSRLPKKIIRRKPTFSKTSTFCLRGALHDDASELLIAWNRCQRLMQSNDIRAGGNAVEMPVRDLIRRKLPSTYHVAHGHVVDARGKPSLQQDLIIADQRVAPLLSSADGTCFVPYESVYAVGEVKASYDRGKDYVRAFTRNLQQLRTELVREEGCDPDPQRANELQQNGVFSFMLFVDSAQFTLEHLNKTYEATRAEFLPNVVCLLDRGVMVYAHQTQWLDGSPILSYSFYPSEDEDTGQKHEDWYLLSSSASDQLGAHFGLLLFALLEHARKCCLPDFPLFSYMQGALAFDEARCITSSSLTNPPDPAEEEDLDHSGPSSELPTT